jgi:predicted dehydrogenase
MIILSEVRVGVIGVGSMGAVHARCLAEGKVPGASLSAVADPVAELTAFSEAKAFSDPQAMLDSGVVDAVLIATPHFSHTSWGIAALTAGLHVLVEKPVCVHLAEGRRLIAAHQNPAQVFAAMFNQRTDPHYLKLRELIHSGELGEIRRVQWVVTNWFRSQAYYDSGGWRATWAGEGGGVLLNQSPHNLDLFQWLFGMPTALRAFCHYGKYHQIEVEDEVTAYCEFANGSTGLFVTSTGEAPGVNRLEVFAERGRVEVTAEGLQWQRNVQGSREFSDTTSERFASPESWQVTIPVAGQGEQHLGIMKNFITAIREGVPLIAPAKEGLASVELANAMLYSSHLGETLRLPLVAEDYEKFLQQKIAESVPRLPKNQPLAPASMASSFGKL